MRLLSALLAVLCMSIPAWSAGGTATVDYDRASGTVSIVASGAGIEDVLSEISSMTGITILIDVGIEKNVTIDIQKTPLADAMHQVLRGLNYALFYSPGNHRKHRLVKVRVLSGDAIAGTAEYKGTRASEPAVARPRVPAMSSMVGDATSEDNSGEPKSRASKGKYDSEVRKRMAEAIKNAPKKEDDDSLSSDEEKERDDSEGQEIQGSQDGETNEEMNTDQQDTEDDDPNLLIQSNEN